MTANGGENENVINVHTGTNCHTWLGPDALVVWYKYVRLIARLSLLLGSSMGKLVAGAIESSGGVVDACVWTQGRRVTLLMGK